MITRQEIRIGNSIAQGEIDCIHPETLEVIKDKARRFISLYEAEPIVLTGDILTSYGFTSHGNNIYSKPLDNFNLKKLVIYKTDEKEVKWYVGFADYYSGKEQTELHTTMLEYIHQLQNLWYCLVYYEI
jgi:hypothetical protein